MSLGFWVWGFSLRISVNKVPSSFPFRCFPFLMFAYDEVLSRTDLSGFAPKGARGFGISSLVETSSLLVGFRRHLHSLTLTYPRIYALLEVKEVSESNRRVILVIDEAPDQSNSPRLCARAESQCSSDVTGARVSVQHLPSWVSRMSQVHTLVGAGSSGGHESGAAVSVFALPCGRVSLKNPQE